MLKAAVVAIMGFGVPQISSICLKKLQVPLCNAQPQLPASEGKQKLFFSLVHFSKGILKLCGKV